MDKENPQAPLADVLSWEDLPEDYRNRFGGMARLYGPAAMVKFYQATVTIIGVGGVGSWVVESLARSGVGHLRLIDLDDVCITNVNRQLPALDGNIGRSKVAVLAERARHISPSIRVDELAAFVTTGNMEELLAKDYSGLIVECIDRAKLKVAMIMHCRNHAIPLVMVGGAGGRKDPLAVGVQDLTKTEGDRLLKQVRKHLKRKHGLPRYAGKKLGIPTVFSSEPLCLPITEDSCSGNDAGTPSLRMDCATGYGAVTHVTGAFAFAAAAAVLQMLMGTGAHMQAEQ